MTDTLPTLAELVAALPEVYQPIHGHPELSSSVSRTCSDRLDHVLMVHDLLHALHGRPLRVLDLGCAQGYFCFRLAERGALVDGVDYLRENIALCSALAAERPTLAVSFREGLIEDALRTMASKPYDLVLGLSVLHHLVHAHGADQVRDWLARAGQGGGVFILELALGSEPLYWAPALPEAPDSLISGFAFVHEIARHSTHLSSIERPMFLASNQYWLLPPLAGRIDSHFTDPHELARGYYGGSRRYYRSGERFIKIFRYDADPALDNRGELAREAAFLENPPAGLRLPALQAFGEHEHQGWLVREHLPGSLLLDRLRQVPTIDHRSVVRQILEQLVLLEQSGLYHGDLRLWNLLVLDDDQESESVVLLDYGSISHAQFDRAWPSDPYLAFFLLVHEILIGEASRPEPLRSAAMSPWGLPPPYRECAAALWGLPRDQWSFRFLLERFGAAMSAGEEVSLVPLTAESLWMREMERAMDIHTDCIRELRWEREQAVQGQHMEQQYALLLVWSQELEQNLAEKNGQIEQLEVLVQHLEAEMGAYRQQLQSAQDQWRSAQDQRQSAQEQWRSAEARAGAAEDLVQLLRHSLSWRLTAPLRALPTLPQRVRSILRRAGHGWRQRFHAGLAAVIRYVLTRPWSAALGFRLLRWAPSLHERLRRLFLAGARPGATPLGEAAPLPAAPAQIERLRRALHAAAHRAD
ncbi:methyltransferase domain-containing protein [Thiocystis violacea]|uniref:methyltransferase domain-containing protein n=1 Tax=Thiocystis violacea TaxID=13725 RepID=UPI0019051E1C|nr:methyltransferase domain-containing protein [Thiocystis violacea]